MPHTAFIAYLNYAYVSWVPSFDAFVSSNGISLISLF